MWQGANMMNHWLKMAIVALAAAAIWGTLAVGEELCLTGIETTNGVWVSGRGGVEGYRYDLQWSEKLGAEADWRKAGHAKARDDGSFSMRDGEFHKPGFYRVSAAPGSGTRDDPYTPAAACAAVSNLSWTSNTEYEKTGNVYVKGRISRISPKGTYTEGGTYGNASYYISADGTENGELWVYRSLYFDGKKFIPGTDIRVGDEVVVCGALMNYKGVTPETVSAKAWLVSLNGVTNGPGALDNPYTASGACTVVSNLTWTSNDEYERTENVYVRGRISRVSDYGTYVEGGTYGNASYYISDDGSEEKELWVYRSLYFNNMKYTSGIDVHAGDEVVVCGELMNYKNVTPETVSAKAWLVSLTREGDAPGSEGHPYTPAEAIDVASGLAWTDGGDFEKTGEVYVRGRISRVACTYAESGAYGVASYWISADGSRKGEVYVCLSLHLNGGKYAGGVDVQPGDEVMVCGALMNFNGDTPQMVPGESRLVSLAR